MSGLRVGGALAFPVEEHILPNGLTLLLQPDDGSVFTFMLWVAAGSRTEERGATGISHYLEHCYSLGSSKLAPRELDEIVLRLGGTKNAFTSYDYTAYHAHLPREALATIIALEADRFATLNLPEASLRAELDVVREERRLRYDDEPTGLLRETTLAMAYERHPYGFPIIGTREDLDHLDRNQVYQYYRRHYVPANATCVLVGGFRVAEARDLIAQHFGRLAHVDAPHTEAPVEPEQLGERRTTLVRETPPVPYVSILYKACSLDDNDAAAFDVLEDILLRGSTSRFDRRLRRELRLATSVSGGFYGLSDPSPFTILARGRDGVHVQDLEDAILEVIAEVCAGGPTEIEVRSARAGTELGFLGGLETTRGRARALGSFQVGSRRGWQAIEPFLDAIARTTPADVQRVARRYLTPERRTVVHQVPKGVVVARRPTGEANVVSISPHMPVRDRETPVVTFRPSHKRFGAAAFRTVLPNGVVVLCRPSRRLPICSVVASVLSGSTADPPLLTGLASLTTALLKTGTERRDEEALAQAFAHLGTGLSAGCDDDALELSTFLRAADLDTGLALLVEVLRAPRFEEPLLERLRGERIAQRLAARGQPHAIAGEALARAVFGAHPYGRPSSGRLPDLRRLALADIHCLYGGAIRPDRLVLAVAGDVDPERFFAQAASLLADWHVDAPAAPLPGTAVDAAPTILLVDKPDQAQAHIRLAHRLVSRAHPDWDALVMANAVLGSSGLSARLPATVRTREGLAYSVRSSLVPLRMDGAFVVSAETRVASCVRALRLMEDEIERLVGDGPSDAEVETVRAYLVGTLPFRMETTEAHAEALVRAETFDLGPDHLERQVERMRALSRDEIANAAGRHLRPFGLQRVVVGPAAALRADLEAIGNVHTITVEDLDVE